MKRTKYFWTALLTLAMAFSLCAVPALAVEAETSVTLSCSADGVLS